MRRARIVGVALCASVCLTAACSSSKSNGAATTTSSSGPVTTAIVTDPQYPFDRTSALQFPGTSLDQRLHMAQQVCDSIKSHGDNYPQWLALITTEPTSALVPFAATPQTLVSFSGLAVRYVCPQYLAQLQDSLSSLSASLSSSATLSSGP